MRCTRWANNDGQSDVCVGGAHLGLLLHEGVLHDGGGLAVEGHPPAFVVLHLPSHTVCRACEGEGWVITRAGGVRNGPGEGGGGSGTQKFVHQKWPNQIFPMVNFRFSRDGPFGLGGGGDG